MNHLAPNLDVQRLREYSANVSTSRESADWDTAQLLDVVHHPGYPSGL